MIEVQGLKFNSIHEVIELINRSKEREAYPDLDSERARTFQRLLSIRAGNENRERYRHVGPGENIIRQVDDYMAHYQIFRNVILRQDIERRKILEEYVRRYLDAAVTI